MYKDRFEKSAPVSEGEELNVKIEALGEKGDGIAKKNGFVLVIPGTKVNDEVKIKITKVLKKVGFAEVVGKADGPVATSENSAPAQSSKPKKPKVEEEDVPEEELPSEEDFSEDFGEEQQ
jgi:predicted RNA-binding protein with TRAM domain